MYAYDLLLLSPHKSYNQPIAALVYARGKNLVHFYIVMLTIWKWTKFLYILEFYEHSKMQQHASVRYCTSDCYEIEKLLLGSIFFGKEVITQLIAVNSWSKTRQSSDNENSAT